MVRRSRSRRPDDDEKDHEKERSLSRSTHHSDISDIDIDGGGLFDDIFLTEGDIKHMNPQPDNSDEKDQSESKQGSQECNNHGNTVKQMGACNNHQQYHHYQHYQHHFACVTLPSANITPQPLLANPNRDLSSYRPHCSVNPQVISAEKCQLSRETQKNSTVTTQQVPAYVTEAHIKRLQRFNEQASGSTGVTASGAPMSQNNPSVASKIKPVGASTVGLFQTPSAALGPSAPLLPYPIPNVVGHMGGSNLILPMHSNHGPNLPQGHSRSFPVLPPPPPALQSNGPVPVSQKRTSHSYTVRCHTEKDDDEIIYIPNGDAYFRTINRETAHLNKARADKVTNMQSLLTLLNKHYQKDDDSIDNVDFHNNIGNHCSGTESHYRLDVQHVITVSEAKAAVNKIVKTATACSVAMKYGTADSEKEQESLPQLLQIAILEQDSGEKPKTQLLIVKIHIFFLHRLIKSDPMLTFLSPLLQGQSSSDKEIFKFSLCWWEDIAALRRLQRKHSPEVTAKEPNDNGLLGEKPSSKPQQPQQGLLLDGGGCCIDLGHVISAEFADLEAYSYLPYFKYERSTDTESILHEVHNHVYHVKKAKVGNMYRKSHVSTSAPMAASLRGLVAMMYQLDLGHHFDSCDRCVADPKDGANESIRKRPREDENHANETIKIDWRKFPLEDSNKDVLYIEATLLLLIGHRLFFHKSDRGKFNNTFCAVKNPKEYVGIGGPSCGCCDKRGDGCFNEVDKDGVKCYYSDVCFNRYQEDIKTRAREAEDKRRQEAQRQLEANQKRLQELNLRRAMTSTTPRLPQQNEGLLAVPHGISLNPPNILPTPQVQNILPIMGNQWQHPQNGSVLSHAGQRHEHHSQHAIQYHHGHDYFQHHSFSSQHHHQHHQKGNRDNGRFFPHHSF